MAEESISYRGRNIVINRTDSDVRIDGRKFKATRVTKHGETDVAHAHGPEMWTSDAVFLHQPLVALAKDIVDNLHRMAGEEPER